MKKILILYDGSEPSIRALDKGKEIVKSFGSGVTLLNVVHNPFPNFTLGHHPAPMGDIKLMYDEIYKKSEELLAMAKKEFLDITKNVETLILEGDPANKIIEYINNEDLELVIIGYHGWGASMNQFMMGSITTKVLHHVKKPVLVVK